MKYLIHKSSTENLWLDGFNGHGLWEWTADRSKAWRMDRNKVLAIHKHLVNDCPAAVVVEAGKRRKK